MCINLTTKYTLELQFTESTKASKKRLSSQVAVPNVFFFQNKIFDTQQ